MGALNSRTTVLLAVATLALGCMRVVGRQHRGPPADGDSHPMTQEEQGMHSFLGAAIARLRPGLGVILVAACALLLATPALAADPTAYLADLPSVDQVTTRTGGSDPFDTAARQFVVFDRLYSLTVALIGDRYTAGQMTPAEKTARDTYLGKRDLTMQALKASLPADQRDYYIGTRFAAWYTLVDTYRASAQFNAQFLALFPARFVQDHASALATIAAQGQTPSLFPPTAAPSLASRVSPVAIPVLFVLALSFPVLLKRARLKLNGKDPFKLYLGGNTYVLHHATGPVEGASKLGTTSVYGGGSYDQGISISSSTTIHEEFFLKQADGHSESIQLVGWNFPVANGHMVSGVWAVKEGEARGTYLVMRNHSTRDTSSAMSFLSQNLQRRRATVIQLIELALCAGLGVLATPLVGSFVVGFATAFAGVVAGSLVWHFAIKGRFLAHFQGVELPRISAALDAIAAARASTP